MSQVSPQVSHTVETTLPLQRTSPNKSAIQRSKQLHIIKVKGRRRLYKFRERPHIPSPQEGVFTSLDHTIKHTSHNLKGNILPSRPIREPTASDSTDDDILYIGSGLTLPQTKTKRRSRKLSAARVNIGQIHGRGQDHRIKLHIRRRCRHNNSWRPLVSALYHQKKGIWFRYLLGKQRSS
jgi:hypothetical protein